MIKNITKKCGLLIRYLLLFVSFCGTSFCLTTTKSVKLEMFCEKLTKPRTQNKENYRPSLMKFKYTEDNDTEFDLYQPLFYTYVYNATVDRDAIITDSSVPLENTIYYQDKKINDFNPYIVSQFLYTEVETKDTREDRHILRHGKFACYLPITISSNGADEFSYISDITAEKWIDYIGDDILNLSTLDTKPERYSKLLKFLKENYDFVYNETGTASFAITNVYYSDYGMAPRTYQIYGDFILSHSLCHKSAKYTFDFHYELETHIDTFGNEEILKLIDSYYGSKIQVSFFLPNFNENESVFLYSPELTNEYDSIRQMDNFSFGYLFAIMIFVSYFLLSFIVMKITNHSYSGLKIWSPLILFVLIYGILSTYLYLFSGMGIFFIFYVIAFVIIEIKFSTAPQIILKKQRIKNDDFITIKI